MLLASLHPAKDQEDFDKLKAVTLSFCILLHQLTLCGLSVCYDKGEGVTRNSEETFSVALARAAAGNYPPAGSTSVSTFTRNISLPSREGYLKRRKNW